MNKVLISCIVRVAGAIDSAATKRAYENALISSNVKKLSELDDRLTADMNKAIGKFDADLNTYTEARVAWDQKATPAVDAIFEQYGKASPNGTIPKPLLVSMAAQTLLREGQIQFADVKTAEEMIAAYISDNEGKLFTVAKGKDGGCKKVVAAE